MKRLLVLALVPCLFVFAAAWAQQESDGASKKEESASAAADGKEKTDKSEKPALAVSVETKGDIIKLKSGAVIKGVQVIRRSPMEIEVLVSDGIVLKIPRKQVAKIEDDGIEPPLGGAANNAAAAPGEPKMIPADKLEPELSKRLTNPLPEPPLKYENQDFITVLEEIAKRFNVPITFGQAVKNMPPNERLWTCQSKPGMNLMTFLQEDFLSQFKNLDLIFQYDKLFIGIKKTNPPGPLPDAAPPASPASPAPNAAPPPPPASPAPNAAPPA